MADGLKSRSVLGFQATRRCLGFSALFTEVDIWDESRGLCRHQGSDRRAHPGTQSQLTQANGIQAAEMLTKLALPSGSLWLHRNELFHWDKTSKGNVPGGNPAFMKSPTVPSTPANTRMLHTHGREEPGTITELASGKSEPRHPGTWTWIELSLHCQLPLAKHITPRSV